MHSEHFLVRCKNCQKIIKQCRCNGGKKLTWELCSDCKTKQREGSMELEKHKMVLFTSVDEDEIVEEIERILYHFLGTNNIDEAFEKCRDRDNIRGYDITITVEEL